MQVQAIYVALTITEQTKLGRSNKVVLSSTRTKPSVRRHFVPFTKAPNWTHLWAIHRLPDVYFGKPLDGCRLCLIGRLDDEPT